LINARVGRQANELITVLRRDKSSMKNSPVILDLGNNNRLTREEVAAVFGEVKDQPQIVIVNTAVPRSWRDPNNLLIDEIARNYPQATVVDWNTLSKGHPEYFGPDGVHLAPEGITAYVNAIMSALNKTKRK
ncbi:MAG: acyltransferase, partial [Actinobacteria bacterium]|nr:acyltransferase [Actinomycetota bacterium]